MAPSLRTVVRRTGLRPLVGTLDSVVRWVAVSELEDPTPYLEGDELLLTTGMRLEGDFSHYVARLVARGVAGLALGVGLSHEEVPPALLAAATAAGLPLLEVPRETPFIAVGKAVSELLAAEQYEEITRAFAAQGRLTRAALLPEGPYAVIDRLAKEIGGWAALLDENTEVRHATHGSKAEEAARELARLRGEHGIWREGASGGREGTLGGRKGASGGREGALGGRQGATSGRLPASLALSGPDEHVVVQPLGGGPRPRGFFAVGASRAFSPVTQTVINAAGSLLTLAVEQGGAQREAERRVRSAVLGLLLAGAKERAGEERARAVLAPLGERLPEEPVVVLAMAGDALEALEPHAFTARLTDPDAITAGLAEPRRHAATTGIAEVGQHAVASRPTEDAQHASTAHFAEADPRGPADSRGGADRRSAAGSRSPADSRSGLDRRSPLDSHSLADRRSAVERLKGPGADVVVLVGAGEAEKVAGLVGGTVGMSSPGPYGELPGALDQARRAFESGHDGLVRFADLAGQGLLGLLDPATAQAFASALLAPLTRYGSRPDLIESLRAYLGSNGHWDAAAQRLGIHRHTLRYRMKRVTELLGRDLDDPGVRAELWIALAATASASAGAPDSSRSSPS
ncbi:PucR family transcriptional regulator [Nonomuraea guangzhouensis]|uniref:PucR family transcriptional regulator ligand-binding domain-containing protein n=1 Tax=Nonomuraea guangzhouensis TaxID=1291555 RepID=A0ABW4GVE4_9ACTN|nr:PucR family transcriptional regulator [Nonomuraea guangzhouensis]